MAQGFLLDNSNMLDVKVEDGHYQVYYGFHRFAVFHQDDAAAKRVTVVQLVNMGVKKSVVSRAFGVNRSSVYFWIETFEQKGMAALISLEKGPESKLTDAIKDYICALYKSLKGTKEFRNTIAEEVKKLYGVEISREAIRRVVNEKKEGEASWWFPRRCLTTSCNFKWPVPWKEKWPNNMKLSGRGRNGFTPSRRFAVGPGVDRSLDVCFYR